MINFILSTQTYALDIVYQTLFHSLFIKPYFIPYLASLISFLIYQTLFYYCPTLEPFHLVSAVNEIQWINIDWKLFGHQGLSVWPAFNVPTRRCGQHSMYRHVGVASIQCIGSSVWPPFNIPTRLFGQYSMCRLVDMVSTQSADWPVWPMLTVPTCRFASTLYVPLACALGIVYVWFPSSAHREPGFDGGGRHKWIWKTISTSILINEIITNSELFSLVCIAGLL